MKKITSALFALALTLSAGQALAVNIVNNTKHKIETQQIKSEDAEDGFGITIDGTPIVPGAIYIMASQAGLPVEELAEIATEVPLLPNSVSTVTFSKSELCVGAASGDVIEIEAVVNGKSELFCLANYEKVYALFPFSGF